MVEDALTRLKNRTRPRVPSRDSSLIQRPDGTAQADDTLTSIPNDVITSWRQDTSEEVERGKDAKELPNPNMASAHQQPKSQPPQLVRSTIRLDPSLEDELESFCRHHKITKELFLEAAWTLLKAQSDLLQKVASTAATRRARRLQDAERKKLATLQQKLQPHEP